MHERALVYRRDLQHVGNRKENGRWQRKKKKDRGTVFLWSPPRVLPRAGNSSHADCARGLARRRQGAGERRRWWWRMIGARAATRTLFRLGNSHWSCNSDRTDCTNHRWRQYPFEIKIRPTVSRENLIGRNWIRYFLDIGECNDEDIDSIIKLE